MGVCVFGGACREMRYDSYAVRHMVGVGFKFHYFPESRKIVSEAVAKHVKIGTSDDVSRDTIQYGGCCSDNSVTSVFCMAGDVNLAYVLQP